jgi:hypothetical protein
LPIFGRCTWTSRTRKAEEEVRALCKSLMDDIEHDTTLAIWDLQERYKIRSGMKPPCKNLGSMLAECLEQDDDMLLAQGELGTGGSLIFQ